MVKNKSFELPALWDALLGSLWSNLSCMLYPDECEDLDNTANREKVLKAMQCHTEIVLPETYDQSVLNAGLKAKDTTGKKTKGKNTQLTDKLAPEQTAKWKETCNRTWEEGVSAWDNAITTLPLIQGNVISKDKRIVYIKMNGGVDLLWKQQRKGQMTSELRLCYTNFLDLSLT